MNLAKECVKAFALFATAACAFQTWALDLDFKGKFFTQAGIGIPNGHQSANEGELLLCATGAEGAVTAYSGNNTMYVDASLLCDYIVNEDKLSFRVKEAWYDYNGGWWNVRIGRQITAWGAADGLQVTDVLCPQDTTSIWTSDYSESRLGIDALRLSLLNETLSLDAYWIPFFTPNELPLKDGNPLKEIVVPSSVSMGGMTVTVNKVSEDSFEKPDVTLRNGEYAARLKAFLPFADLSLYGYYGWDDMPVMKYSVGTAITVGGSYERMAMFGADASIPIRSVVLRLEGAVFPDRAMALSADEQVMAQFTAMRSGKTEFDYFVRRNQMAGLIGLDFTPAFCTITVQYYIDTVTGSVGMLDREHFVHKATCSVSKSFLRDTLDLSLTGIMELKHFSGMINPCVKYSVSDQLSVSLDSSFFFRGPDKDNWGEYAAYEDLDCISLKAVFSF